MSIKLLEWAGMILGAVFRETRLKEQTAGSKQGDAEFGGREQRNEMRVAAFSNGCNK